MSKVINEQIFRETVSPQKFLLSSDLHRQYFVNRKIGLS